MKHEYENHLEPEQSYQNKNRNVWSFMTFFINDLKQFELLFHTKIENFQLPLYVIITERKGQKVWNCWYSFTYLKNQRITIIC